MAEHQIQIKVPDAVAGCTVYATIPHCVVGDLVVGNFNIVGSNASAGSGLGYNMASSNFATINLPGGRTTSLYGVWQNGIGSSYYTLIGGTAEPLGLTKALIVNYDSVAESFGDPTERVIAPGAVVSHFGGVTAANGGFNVLGMTAALTNGPSTGEWFGFIATNGSGFATDGMWSELRCFIRAATRQWPTQFTATTPCEFFRSRRGWRAALHRDHS